MGNGKISKKAEESVEAAVWIPTHLAPSLCCPLKAPPPVFFFHGEPLAADGKGKAAYVCSTEWSLMLSVWGVWPAV